MVFILFAVVTAGMAQDKLEFGDTPTTANMPKYESRPSDYKNKHKIQWVKNNTKGLLQGNPCMDEVTHEMGFVYLIQPKGQPYNKSEWQRNIHNLAAKIRITLRNGPFWKFKLQSWRKKCRAETGDFAG